MSLSLYETFFLRFRNRISQKLPPCAPLPKTVCPPRACTILQTMPGPVYLEGRLSAFPAVQLAEHLVRISDPVICKQNPAEPFFFPQAEPDHRGVRLLAVP